MPRFFILVAVLLVGVICASCDFSTSTANIKSAQLARGYQDGKAVGTTNTFAPTDNPLHCVVEVANAPGGTRVKSVWTAVDATGLDGVAHKDQRIDEKEFSTTDTGSVIDFTLSNDAQWPVGRYKVDIYLNDKLDRTLEFEVR
jgi:hypothetical protein